ncbi:MAG: hypothetical protein DRN29_07170 [Thermoplasmata archaeon]|nr:MAG: hypothetical protein DRN29_07170 [Thermoplasmata archaeon]
MEIEIEEAINEILESVDVDRETVEKDLRKFLEYGVPLEHAKEAVINKYGSVVKEKKLKDVRVNERNICVVAKILAIDEREVEVRGERRKIYRGLLGDETAVLPFTAWKDFGLQKGDVIKIRNASSSEWEGQPRLSLSEWSEVEKVDYEIDLVKRVPKKYNLIDLKPGLSNVEARGKILSIEERVVSIGGEERKVFSGIIADETAKVRFTSWHDFGLKEGDVIKIKGGYVRKWRGAPQLIFDENSEVEKMDEEVIMEEIVVPLYKVVEAGGGISLTIQGVILDVRKDSGIIFRCPKCNRRIRNGVCEEDGEVEGVADLRIRALLDDGTGAVDVIFNREISEKLLGKNMEEYLRIAKEAMDYSIVYEEIFDKLAGKPIKVKGDSMPSDFIVTIFASHAEMAEIDEKKEAEELLMQLEG